MVVNADKINERITVENWNIKVVSSAEFLSLQIDDNLSFNLRIFDKCKLAARKLNVIITLENCTNPRKFYFMSPMNGNWSETHYFGLHTLLTNSTPVSKRTI